MPSRVTCLDIEGLVCLGDQRQALVLRHDGGSCPGTTKLLKLGPSLSSSQSARRPNGNTRSCSGNSAVHGARDGCRSRRGPQSNMAVLRPCCADGGPPEFGARPGDTPLLTRSARTHAQPHLPPPAASTPRPACSRVSCSALTRRQGQICLLGPRNSDPWRGWCSRDPPPPSTLLHCRLPGGEPEQCRWSWNAMRCSSACGQSRRTRWGSGPWARHMAQRDAGWLLLRVVAGVTAGRGCPAGSEHGPKHEGRVGSARAGARPSRMRSLQACLPTPLSLPPLARIPNHPCRCALTAPPRTPPGPRCPTACSSACPARACTAAWACTSALCAPRRWTRGRRGSWR